MSSNFIPVGYLNLFSKVKGGNAFETVPEAEPVASRCPYTVGSAQTIGDRKVQEDSFLLTDLSKPEQLRQGVLAVVADGVGGMSNGQVASNTAVRSIAAQYARQSGEDSDEKKLLTFLAAAQEEVLKTIHAGTKCASTLVCALIRDMNLSFISVGDSHIYLCRAGGLLQLNREHVLGHTADETAALGRPNGNPSPARRKAITSYLGKEDLSQIDRIIEPIRLQAGDVVLLMSDGVYGTLTDDEMISCCTGTAQETANAIIRAVNAAKCPGQDNATCVVVTCNATN